MTTKAKIKRPKVPSPVELENKQLKDRIHEMEMKLIEVPKVDRKRIQAATESLMFSLLLDAKAALLTTGDPGAAQVLIRIQHLEANMPSLTIMETVLLQKAKAITRKWAAGLEVDSDEVKDLLRYVEKLL